MHPIIILWPLRSCKMQPNHISIADNSLDYTGFTQLSFCSNVSDTSHAHLEVLLSCSKHSGAKSYSSISSLLSAMQRKVHRTSFHASDFQFVCGSTQRPNTIHRCDKRWSKEASLCPVQSLFEPCLPEHQSNSSLIWAQWGDSILPAVFLLKVQCVQHFLLQLAVEISWFCSPHFLHSKCHQPSLPDSHVTLKKASESQTLIFFPPH